MLTGLRFLLKPDVALPADAVNNRFEEARTIIDELADENLLSVQIEDHGRGFDLEVALATPA